MELNGMNEMSAALCRQVLVRWSDGRLSNFFVLEGFGVQFSVQRLPATIGEWWQSGASAPGMRCMS